MFLCPFASIKHVDLKNSLVNSASHYF